MQEIIAWVLEHLDYWVITLFMAIESSFIPFPSEVIVPPAAWLASTPGSELNIFWVVIFATIGADIGALFNYYLAVWLGRPSVYAFAHSRIGHMCLLDAEKIEHAENYFKKNGVVSTLVGRLIPAVRQLISIPAGLAKMHLGKFLLYTTIGAGLCNTVLAVIGYSLSKVPGLKTKEQVVEKAGEYSHIIGYGLLAILVFVVIYLVYRASKAPKTAA